MSISGDKARAKSLKKYYANPNTCIKCECVIMVDKKQKACEARKQKFCSHSCAASANNHKYPKRHLGANRVCPDCGGRKDGNALRCNNCKNLWEFHEAEKRKIKDLYCNGNAGTKYNHIRRWARKALVIWGVPKHCVICGFDIVVEAHHWSRLANFPDDALVGEVNSRENLDWLCPNDHALVERSSVKKPVKIACCA